MKLGSDMKRRSSSEFIVGRVKRISRNNVRDVEIELQDCRHGRKGGRQRWIGATERQSQGFEKSQAILPEMKSPGDRLKMVPLLFLSQCETRGRTM